MLKLPIKFKFTKSESSSSELKKLLEELRLPVVEFIKRDPSYKVLESYYVLPPFIRVTIADTGKNLMYFVEEPLLSDDEKYTHYKLIDIILDELKPPIGRELRSPTEYIDYIIDETERILRKYSKSLGITQERRIKLLYYIERDLIGYGPIDPLLRDPNIEDISCNGVGIPIYIWHRKYESIPTNILLVNEDSLNELIIRLAHLAGKHISLAFPIVDAMLPGGHRLAATFAREASVKGPSFTIRKFREKPFSIVELIKHKTIDPVTAAYMWLMLEHMKTAIVAGGTGAGKTSLLNALSLFIKPGMKIVTIEETPELRLPHENWVQLTSREAFLVSQAAVTSKITLMDLVKLSLRYRPDYIIVGEIRGEEAYVLFQAIATGHGGLSTLHAESLDHAIKRLTSPPMNIPPTYISLMNVYVQINRIVTRVEKGVITAFRRVSSVREVLNENDSIEIARWDPRDDRHVVDFSNSIHLKDIAARKGLDYEDITEELYKRVIVLRWMLEKGIMDISEVSQIIFEYYNNPRRVYDTAFSELREKGALYTY